MILEWKTLFFISLIVYYNSDEDLSNVLFNNSKSLLNILILDSSVVAVDSDISYKGSVLVFLAAIVTLRSLFYLILYSRYYSTLYS